MKRPLLFTLIALALVIGSLTLTKFVFSPANPDAIQNEVPANKLKPLTKRPNGGWNLWTNADGAIYHRDGTNLWWAGGEMPKEWLPNVKNLPTLEQMRAQAEEQRANQAKQLSAYNAINEQPILFYGRVVDEKTNAVGGATVHANVAMRTLNSSGEKKFTVTSGENGYFTISGVSGENLAVGVTKEPDYYFAPVQLFRYSQFYGATRHQPDPNSPVVFVLHKIKGPESLLYWDRAFGAPNTGEPVRIDFTTGEKVISGGDLVVSIMHPEPYSNLKQPAWSMKIAAMNGGFIHTDQIRLEFMHEAPESGYQPVIEVVMESDDPNYRRQFEGCYYVKSRNGQHYAKVRFRMNTYWDERGVPFGIQCFVNTNASRNLEVPLGDTPNVFNVRTQSKERFR